MRHGQAEHNTGLIRLNESNRKISNLTVKGRAEVAKSAQKLNSLAIKLDVIYSSPLAPLPANRSYRSPKPESQGSD